MEQDLIYEIKVEYGNHPRNPSNIFFTMGDLINSMNYFDNLLIESLPVTYQSNVVLESVETGSIIARLRTVLLNIDDEALKELDWKKFIGSFLVRGKHKIIDTINKSNGISSREEVDLLTSAITDIAKEDFGAYDIEPKISEGKLLNALQTISDSMKQLKEDQRAIYISSEGAVSFNKKFSLTTDEIEKLLTENTLTSTIGQNLTVKKPDYLGKSMWEFYLDGKEKIISARVEDIMWLANFQSGLIDLRPGDSIDVLMESSVALDKRNREVHTTYRVLNVYKIIKNRRDEEDSKQITFF